MRTLRTAALVAAAVAAVALAWTVLTLPPRPLTLATPPWSGPHVLARGAFHVHSNRSDGTGTVAGIAAAAARAGLAFVILTDHGDGTESPDPPAYHAGVLCIDAVEISTAQGHYAAVGMRPAPYPLGGDARDVVEDVARLGGFGIVTHPGSPKPDLRWREPDAPFDAIEWLNADAEWRDESWTHLARLLLDYPFRGPEAIAAVFDRPASVLATYDDLARRRPVVLIAGADAHARFALRGTQDPYEGVSLPGLPSYEASFRVFALRVELERPPSGVAGEDADRVVDALRAGHVYTAIDALAGPAVVDFAAARGTNRARGGDRLAGEGPVDFRVRANAPSGSVITLLEDGRPVAQASGSELAHHATEAAGAFRVEVRLPDSPGTPPVPWIVTNPVYVGPPPGHEVGRRAAASPASTVPILDLGRLADWHIERAPSSSGRFELGGAPDTPECRWVHDLGPGIAAGQYVAFARPLAPSSVVPYDRLSFRLRAGKPMRVSVQLRAPGGVDGQRWQRSVYADETPRELSVYFNDMRPIGPTASPRPDVRLLDAVLFVVDTINARAGTRGEVWLRDVRLEGPGPAR